MRYFERKRLEVRPENGRCDHLLNGQQTKVFDEQERGWYCTRCGLHLPGRCGQQPRYGAKHGEHYLYFCTGHYVRVRTPLIGQGWEFYDLADGETMGCDYEISV
jgi:hypothetical protein